MTEFTDPNLPLLPTGEPLPVEVPRPWAVHRELFNLALESLVRHSGRTVVTVLCLVAVLVPFLTATALLEGVRRQAHQVIAEGPDLFVTGYEFGRNASIPQSVLDMARSLSGTNARGRITGRTYVKDVLLTLIGVSGTHDEPAPRHGEVWLGASAAKSLGVSVGSHVTFEEMVTLELTVARILPSSSPLGLSQGAIMPLESAQTLFAVPGRLTEVQIWLEAGDAVRQNRVLDAAFKLRQTGVPMRIQTRPMVEGYVDRGLSVRGGTFQALFMVALALAIPALMVTGGFGMSTRRREVALFKALGFSIVDVLEVSFWETLVMGGTAAGLALVVSWTWVHGLDGYPVASFFVSGLEHGWPDRLPAHFLPLPFLVSMITSWILIGAGSLSTSYRAARTLPAEVMR